MKRTPITDGNGSWFDEDAAASFGEGSWWDGSNHMSTATGSQWYHQILLYTPRSGRWILNSFSACDGDRATYRIIDESAAVAWLVANEADDDDLDMLPTTVQTTIRAGIAAEEL